MYHNEYKMLTSTQQLEKKISRKEPNKGTIVAAGSGMQVAKGSGMQVAEYCLQKTTVKFFADLSLKT